MRAAVSALCLLSSVLWTGGCTSTGVTLPPLPAWEQPKGNAIVPAVVVANETMRRLPGIVVNYSDRTYTIVAESWLDKYIVWTWHAAKQADIDAFVDESRDCDNFTGLFVEIAPIAASKAGVKAQPLVGRVLVQDSPTTRHELAGVMTDNGPFIIEPQVNAPRRKWRLEAYPKPILAVTWGSYNRPW